MDRKSVEKIDISVGVWTNRWTDRQTHRETDIIGRNADKRMDGKMSG
jgi:hypothetical protein